MIAGPDSPLYFYQVTNAGSPVGFFSNRNHQAAFLLCLLPLAASVRRALRRPPSTVCAAFPALAAILYVYIAIVGVAATRSRAGVALGLIALVGVAAMILRADALRRHWRAAAALGLGVGVALGGVLVLGLAPIMERFDAGGDPRFEGWPIVLHAAQSYLLLGSGVGSFELVYGGGGAAEPGQPDLLQPRTQRLSRALARDQASPGAALFALFAGWLAWRGVSIWRRRPSAGGQQPRGGLYAAGDAVAGALDGRLSAPHGDHLGAVRLRLQRHRRLAARRGSPTPPTPRRLARALHALTTLSSAMSASAEDVAGVDDQAGVAGDQRIVDRVVIGGDQHRVVRSQRLG